ncbi:hypothetical protein VNO77_04732 [Canavalia gladiata]|uniref:Uncharacterized protein n=1 Tax=Canavalia gladiata TaxID=3824 RepID=A0AAN9R9C3_CANGL
MATIVTTGAHTSHAQPNFVSAPQLLTDENLICLPTSGYVALGTHHLLSPLLAFSNYLLFPLLGHQPLNSSLQGETRHLRNENSLLLVLSSETMSGTVVVKD